MKNAYSWGRSVEVFRGSAPVTALSAEWEGKSGESGEVWRITTQCEPIDEPATPLLRQIQVELAWDVGNAHHVATVDTDQVVELGARAVRARLAWLYGAGTSARVSVSMTRAQRSAPAPIHTVLSGPGELVIPPFATEVQIIAGDPGIFAAMQLLWLGGTAASGNTAQQKTLPESGVWVPVPRWARVVQLAGYPVIGVFPVSVVVVVWRIGL